MNWCIDNVCKMKIDPRISEVFMEVIVDTPITMSRNRAVRRALERQVDYILMIDSDMAPDFYTNFDAPRFWDVAWEFMMTRRALEDKWWASRNGSGAQASEGLSPLDILMTEPRREIRRYLAPATIASPYCGPPPIENVYVFEWKVNTSGDPHPLAYRLKQITREQAALRSGVQEVPALCTGLILYDARVFHALPKPWFDYEYEDKYQTEKVTTEDVYQTRNASMMGFPQYIAWDCWSGHIKQKIVPKPCLITTDMVCDAVTEAIKKGYRSDEVLFYQCKSALEDELANSDVEHDTVS